MTAVDSIYAAIPSNPMTRNPGRNADVIGPNTPAQSDWNTKRARSRADTVIGQGRRARDTFTHSDSQWERRAVSSALLTSRRPLSRAPESVYVIPFWVGLKVKETVAHRRHTVTQLSGAEMFEQKMYCLKEKNSLDSTGNR